MMLLPKRKKVIAISRRNHDQLPKIDIAQDKIFKDIEKNRKLKGLLGEININNKHAIIFKDKVFLRSKIPSSKDTRDT